MDLCIADNVLSKLEDLYHLSKGEIQKILSKPPQASIIRVNTKKISTRKAIEVSAIKDLSPDFHIDAHPLLEDLIIVTPKTFENNPIPVEIKDVIVDASCAAAVLRGADIFAPGVLAVYSSVQAGDVVSVYCDVDKKCRKGFMKVFEGKKFYLGNGIAKYRRFDLFEENIKKSGVGITMNECKYNLPSFNDLISDLFFPQNLPSVLVGHLLDPQENDLVLDMCAAPGGKTTHIATLLRNKGLLISIDKTPNKVEKIQNNVERLGLENVKCFCFDSTKLLDVNKDASTDSMEPPFPAHHFDRILLDPPCSGLGQRPQLRYVFTNKELSVYPAFQKKFFKQAVELLKPGGTLVFSTCTLLPEENEEQVAWALKTFPELTLADQSPRIGEFGLQGYGLSKEQTEKVQRFDHVFRQRTTRESEQQQECSDVLKDTIGFFMAKFIKK